MKVCTRAIELKQFESCVLVPTMGALHQGHSQLIRQGKKIATVAGRPCVVSVFVNPTQFNEPADFERYPRTLDADVSLCEAAGADAVFAPEVAEMYPSGSPLDSPTLPPVANGPGLEDGFRPGHFAGVCIVVERLFLVCGARDAVFGEKDWQQLQVVRALVVQQGLDVAIHAAPTVREADGLAMSSRNRFLTAADRERARQLRQALMAAQACQTPPEAEAAMRAVLLQAGIAPDYAVVRDAGSLLPVSGPCREGCRALIAARVGTVRLLDNAAWPG